MMKWYSLFLFPFAILYGLIIKVRNWLFDRKIMKSVKFDIPVIALGNLSVGGTGKTPHTIHIANILAGKGFNVCILSRGYRRKKSGFMEVVEESTVHDVGDEPLLLHNQTVHSCKVFVASNRVLGIMKILNDFPKTDLVLLDDALQHRSLEAGLNILLTKERRPYYKDYLLPVGQLRDERKSARRSDIVIVSDSEGENVQQKIKGNLKVPVFNSQLNYKEPEQMTGETLKQLPENWLVVSGIADPSSLVNHLKSKGGSVKLCQFNDHHHYDEQDIQKVQKIFNNLALGNAALITTWKDWVKIKSVVGNVENQPVWFVQDFDISIGSEKTFEEIITTYVRENRRDDKIS